MRERLVFYVLRLRERLWVRPLLNCLATILVLYLASYADLIDLKVIPHIDPSTIEKLLTVLSSSMLAVATFAVGSMVSAYASASGSATPRAFALVLADDVSQNALSSFIAAFIYSVVALIGLRTGLYQANGHFVLFSLTVAVFAWVVVTFVRWVDNIARLGRIGTTIDKAEAATRAALHRRLSKPRLGGIAAADDGKTAGQAVHARTVGFVQHIDMPRLQAIAEELETTLTVAALPGTLLAPHQPFVRVDIAASDLTDDLRSRIAEAAIVGPERTFDGDPRFGLIVLAEIAGRALSPGINDPGTAIAILARFTRLFTAFGDATGDKPDAPEFDRVRVPDLGTADMFDDAFTAISRDGAGLVEVGIRLQKTLLALAATGNPDLKAQAARHSALALSRARQALIMTEDLDRLRAVASQVEQACG